MTTSLESLKALVEARKLAEDGTWHAHPQNLRGAQAVFVNQSYGLFSTEPHAVLVHFPDKNADETKDWRPRENADFVCKAANWTATSAPILIERMERMQRALEAVRDEQIQSDINDLENRTLGTCLPVMGNLSVKTRELCQAALNEDQTP